MPLMSCPAEKGRAMRDFVRAIADAVCEQHGGVAFGLLRDVPAAGRGPIETPGCPPRRA